MAQQAEQKIIIVEEKSFTDELAEDDSNDWIVTFADLVTLLLVFFIMLYTMSTIDLLKFQAVSQSMTFSFGMAGSEDEKKKFTKNQDEKESQRIRQVKKVTITSTEEERLVHDINKAIRKKKRQGMVVSYIKGGQAIIHIRGKVLFESGSALLNEKAKPVLADLMDIIQENPYFRVNIKGHTDNIPISTPKFPSNWELSAIRATTVLKYMISKGFKANRLTATGYGDVMPLFPNNTPANRAKNRRIEFVLEKHNPD